MADEDSVLLAREDGTAVLTLNRPDQLNPLDWQTVKLLARLVGELEREEGIRTVIVTGEGRAFSAGGDLKGYQSLYRDPAAFRAFLDDFHALLGAIEASAKVYVAAVNGVTVAGGLELMLACDVVLLADTAKVGDGHLNFGQLPGAGGSQRLPRTVGALRAKRLLFSGELLEAAEAERIGLASAVVPAGALQDEARRWARELAGKSSAGLAGAKRLVNEGMQLAFEDALRLERDFVHDYATRHPDAMEGLDAFAEKRKPRYR